MNYKVQTGNFGISYGFVDYGQLFLDALGKPYIATKVIRTEDDDDHFYNAVALSDGGLRCFDGDDNVWIPTKYNLEIEM